MSTEYQPHSPHNQAKVIAEFARKRGFEIVRTYMDEAKSGLTISGRPALKQLIQDVVGGQTEYRAVLVYDVSRWGRFQDIDESAHYEFLCRQMNVDLHYCAEGFENDGSMVSSLVKNMKRAMAADYSRRHGQRIREGQDRSVNAGFWTCGMTPFGYQRMLVDGAGNPKHILARGERKYIATDRLMAVPGPPDEVALVRRVFDMYVRRGVSLPKIEIELNRSSLVTRGGAAWASSSIRHLLSNPIYIGTNMFGRRKSRAMLATSGLQQKEKAFEAIVPTKVFALAQDFLKYRSARPKGSDELLIANLRAMVERHGELARSIARKHPVAFSNPTYRKRFGSITAALRLAGVEGLPPEKPKPHKRYLRSRVLDEIRARFKELGIPCRTENATQHEVLASGFRIAVVSFRTSYKEFCFRCWDGYLDKPVRPEAVVILRAERWADEISDLYVVTNTPLNMLGLPQPALGSIPQLEPYRCLDLEPLFKRAQVASWVANLVAGAEYG